MIAFITVWYSHVVSVIIPHINTYSRICFKAIVTVTVVGIVGI